MRDELHVERLHQAEQFRTDIADAERTERASDKADAHVIGSLGKTSRRLARELVLDHQFAGQRQHERDDRNRDGPPDPVRRDDQRDIGIGAGLDIDRIIANAEAGDDRKPPALRHAFAPETMREQDQRIEILQLLALDRAGGIR